MGTNSRKIMWGEERGTAAEVRETVYRNAGGVKTKPNQRLQGGGLCLLGSGAPKAEDGNWKYKGGGGGNPKTAPSFKKNA